MNKIQDIRTWIKVVEIISKQPRIYLNKEVTFKFDLKKKKTKNLNGVTSS